MIDVCAEALVARELLLEALGRRQLSPADRERVRGISAHGWRLFLSAEGCAAMTQQLLTDLGILGALKAEASDAIRTRAFAEAQRVLSARGQIAQIARIAERRSWRVVVLKGGVGVAESSEVLHLMDLDVLTTPQVAPELAIELQALGYSAGAEGSSSHLPAATAGGIPVEVHHRLDPEVGEADDGWWERTQKLKQFPPLERPGNADHLWHLLVHSVEVHSDRRGRLRDALLMSRVLGSCDERGIGDVESRVAAHSGRAALSATLSFLREIGGASPSDPFRRRTAARYALEFLEGHVRLPRWIRGQLIALSITIVDGPRELRYYARRILPTLWSAKEGEGESAMHFTARVLRRVAAQLIVVLIAPLVAFVAGSALEKASRAQSR